MPWVARASLLIDGGRGGGGDSHFIGPSLNPSDPISGEPLFGIAGKKPATAQLGRGGRANDIVTTIEKSSHCMVKEESKRTQWLATMMAKISLPTRRVRFPYISSSQRSKIRLILTSLSSFNSRKARSSRTNLLLLRSMSPVCTKK